MEKRMIMALVLTAAVVGLTPVLFPPAPVPARRADSTAVAPATPTQRAGRPSAPATAAQTPPAAPRVEPIVDSAATIALIAAETTAVNTDLATYRFVNVGAAPVSLVLKRYDNLATRGSAVDLGATGLPLLRYRLVVPGDTVDLSSAAFARTSSAAPGPGTPLTYEATVGGHRVAVSYSFNEDSYIVGVTGRVTSPPVAGTGARFLLVDLPSSFPLTEADSVGDRRSL